MKINLDKEAIEFTEPEVKKPENKKESTCLDIVADIGEGICDVFGSILD